MKTKHTPGPWIIYGEHQAGDRNYVVITAPDAHAEIARLYFDPTLLEEMRAAVADSMLIAAAPEMLKALREVNDAVAKVLANLGAALQPGCDCFWCEWLPRARAAIAKATGGEP